MGRARSERTETTDQHTQIIDRVVTVFLFFIIKYLRQPSLRDALFARGVVGRLTRYDAAESVNRRIVVDSVSRVIYSFRTIRRV